MKRGKKEGSNETQLESSQSRSRQAEVKENTREESKPKASIYHIKRGERIEERQVERGESTRKQMKIQKKEGKLTRREESTWKRRKTHEKGGNYIRGEEST